MAEPTSDGRKRSKVTDWTGLDYVVVDVEGGSR
jgi:hypothetical protein